jgi:hypothetical protein
LGTGGIDGAEEIAQRFTVNDEDARTPSAPFELGCRAIELFRGRPGSRGIRPPDFMRNGRGTRDQPLRRDRHQLYAADERDMPVRWRREPADKCQDALCSGR